VVEETNYVATQGLTPELTILLDIDVTDGLARKGKKSADRFEKENIFFHQKVRDGYLKLATDEPERWLVIDAAQSKAAIRKIIWRRVTRLLLGQGRQV
jgi:dTMP kinase